jgi:hypothetical protein
MLACSYLHDSKVAMGRPWSTLVIGEPAAASILDRQQLPAHVV